MVMLLSQIKYSEIVINCVLTYQMQICTRITSSTVTDPDIFAFDITSQLTILLAARTTARTTGSESEAKVLLSTVKTSKAASRRELCGLFECYSSTTGSGNINLLCC
ncbi:unnamed protein product [Amoebophrya sp. A120]|nr:unnamed protein product [Amoebophrya sp. A120]|eukprot:GSA120T00020630001.1